ncbi:MAG: DeoR/GlpR transcriptional regulator [Alphaproteobacteria bacterium]|nr:DeoR/GlpR transcriptional regulator [Alphaproteobacteria bacterium]MDE2494039.1 DeoR/GlpR transcriptional regulator [Alphaproteobacteria bacterium]
MNVPSEGLLAEPRRRMILEWMQEEGSARVRDLAETFSVSEATIRQDLERLEVDGHIVREHGGAYLKSVPQQVRALALHHLVNMNAKAQIGQLAASLINDGDTIILDSGSTTTEIARFIEDRQNLNVITNALNIALMVGAHPSFSVHVTGGQFKAPTLSLSGEKAADFFHGIYAEKLFLAAAAISLDAGLTYPSVADLYVKKAMIEATSHTYLVVDSTKIGKKAFSSLGPVDLVNTIITDEGISAADQAAFEKAGVEILVAK